MEEKERQKNSRAPVVAVLGHVDHGKTTLLDAIRKTNVVAHEAGGITQRIGATVVEIKDGKKITFIDTPGHAAFTKMRSRGAEVADIAVLVVAADDGVKPQTREALSLIKEAGIPFIIALTKMDLPSANLDSARNELEKEGVLFEKRGGDVPLVPVSAKKNEGIGELLEMIALVTEISGIRGDPAFPLEAVVIEVSKDKRGPTVSVVVKNGTLKKRSEIYSEGRQCRVRGLFDETGKSKTAIYPGEPALILGFEDLPPVGARITSKELEKKVSLDKKYLPTLKKLKETEVAVVIKTQNAGSMEAILGNIPEKVVVVATGIGDVTEGDVFLAKTTGSKLILVFEAKIPSSVLKLAETEGVIIERFEVIYELFERLEEILKKGQIEVQGQASIVSIFPYDDKKVAGCKVLEGQIKIGDALLLKRGDRQLGEVKIITMKRQKQKISVAKAGEEFGVLFEPQLDFTIDDVLLSVVR